jgi:hypothetical protein
MVNLGYLVAQGQKLGANSHLSYQVGLYSLSALFDKLFERDGNAKYDLIPVHGFALEVFDFMRSPAVSIRELKPELFRKLSYFHRFFLRAVEGVGCILILLGPFRWSKIHFGKYAFW